jgi:hypothetical protein
MFKTTPGPWSVFELANDSDTYGINAGRPIITAKNGDIEVCGVVPNPADAPILAASIDLLKSLVSLENILGHLLEAGRISWPIDDAPVIHGYLELAQAAIAKAQGKES